MLAENAKPGKIRKDTTLAQTGEIQTVVSFLFEGVLSSYIITSGKSKKIFNGFYYHYGDFVVGGFELDQPALVSIAPVSGSADVLQIPVDIFQAALAGSAELRAWFQTQQIQRLTEQAKLNNIRTQKSPEEKIAWLYSTYPGLSCAVEQKFIASFLGITTKKVSDLKAEMLTSKG
ncbi:MAG: hypothetical protein LUC06_02235 [Oscillospiraceae bacterium]|nr:hypothetical protein [Oscillospiraceae bacterium]